MLDLRLLRFFIAIYEEKNITAAAERCHVSQPSLSAGLRQLEETLGDSLFIRGKKGVAARDQAHYLYPHAVKLVEEARRLPALFRQKATRARLNMAIMPDLSRRRVAGLLQQVQAVLPELDLTLSDYGTPADCRLTLDALRREDEIFLPLWEEDYVLCVRSDHPLASRQQLIDRASAALSARLDSGGADWRRPATSHPPNSKATATAEAIAIFFRVNSMRHPVVAGQNTTTDLKKRCD